MRAFALAFASALLAISAPSASATLVFNSGADTPSASIWAAADDGKGARRIATGLEPRISPNGRRVAFQSIDGAPGTRAQLLVIPVAGGQPRVLLDPQWTANTEAWSPDSRTIAAVTGPELGTKQLVLIDVATGSKRTVTSGQFYGVSFSPTGGAIVYSRATSDTYPPQSSLWVASVTGGKPVRITRGHPDVDPLWGPRAVAFARQRKPTRRFDSWKQDLYVVSPSDRAPRRLTHERPSFLLTGPSPVSWSADGRRLLGVFGGQDTAFAQTVDPASGAARTLGRVSDAIIGTALSRDGTTILGTRGGYEPSEQTDVITVPYSGGTPHVLARHAFSPDWNR